MERTKINCDGCGAELTDTDAQPRYRLVLAAEPLPHRTNGINMVHVSPPIKEPHHFCHKGCVERWIDKTK